ncbi:MAG: flagellar hook-basal body complex protein FliE [Treponema sp.]|nr:flagellar hook-basal body complex protein FliE [Treponema sp.]
MQIPEFGTLLMARNSESHFGVGPVTTQGSSVSKTTVTTGTTSTSNAKTDGKISFQDYLLQAMNSVNDQQMEVSALQEKLITSPDEVDIHDVTIAMSKARMSLNLAQTVIDRLVSGWNEITTTR